MHEVGICEAILAAVERQAAGRRVQRVRVRVGALHRVAEPAMDQAFTMLSEGTVAERAALDLVQVPVRLTCRDCGGSQESDDPVVLCARCGGADLDTAGGDELLLEWIQVEGPG
jgi:hydrogenase nickel incorporation protein HypA/HybF